jgi:hypothetical protein
MTVYSPKEHNTRAAVVVFPGGGFEGLAIDLEGTEVCDWLTSEGITCVLLKYRVPSPPYDWHCNCRPNDLATSTLALEDAQRTIVALARRYPTACLSLVVQSGLRRSLCRCSVVASGMSWPRSACETNNNFL